MSFSSRHLAIAAFLLANGAAEAFSTLHRGATAFVSSSRTPSNRQPSTTSVGKSEGGPCTCPNCMKARSSSSSSSRPICTRLFSDATAAEAETEEDEIIPAEVEALDGIESPEEAHNAERPARKSLQKKKKDEKALSEFAVGETINDAKVRTITNYGAFVDFGSTTDGLLHISQLSTDFVSDVNEILSANQEVAVRILSIDEGKGQVALTLLTEKQEEDAKQAAADRQQRRPARGGGGGGSRPDSSAVVAGLNEKGWNPDQFVQGKVVSTVDFGAFVRIDVSQLNGDVTGEMDGLVHISSLTAGRADSVTSIVNVDDTVNVRVKGIMGSKVSLSMLSPEDEQAKVDARASSGGGGRGGPPAFEGNKDWREAVDKIKADLPEFRNGPVVVDLRK